VAFYQYNKKCGHKGMQLARRSCCAGLHTAPFCHIYFHYAARTRSRSQILRSPPYNCVQNEVQVIWQMLGSERLCGNESGQQAMNCKATLKSILYIADSVA
jgi:hypothetical protein